MKDKEGIDMHTEKTMKNLDEQRERLKSVLEYLYTKDYTQKDICGKIGITQSDLTHYKNGKVKVIPQTFLEKMQKEFHINPDYIRLESEEMLDIKGEKYLIFEKVVEGWTTVERGDNKYLHFQMDKNFYDFLIELNEYREMEQKGLGNIADKIEELKQLYAGDPNVEEFVLISRNNFIEILQEIEKEKKSLAEIIDFTEHLDYLEE